MAQPTAYTPAHEFLVDEGVTPAFPGSELDIELAALKTTTDEIRTNLALIQRDDGDLANDSIGLDQLSDIVLALLGDADALAALQADFDAVEANVALTAADAASTAADAISTAADAAATAADVISTNADAASTAADATSTAADAISTAADAAATAQDLIDTNAALAATLVAADNFDDVYLGSKASDPTLDNDGNALVEGQLYWNSTSNTLKVYDGAAWNGYSATSGITELVEDTTPQLGGNLDLNSFVITGLEIGTNVQAYDATLASIASLGTAADKMLYTTGVDTWAELAVTSVGRALLDDTTQAAQQTTLGLGTGDSPQFTGVEVGHASDTTVTRAAAGVIAVEGVPLYPNIPQNSQSVAYTFVLGDAGKDIFHPAADTTARTWTIPANASVAYPVGSFIALSGEGSSGVITLAITSDTLVWAPSGGTGSRTLTAPFQAVIVKKTATKWFLTGVGIT